MNWTSNTVDLERIANLRTDLTYKEIAARLTEELGSYVSDEQVRSALRRHEARKVMQEARQTFAPPAIQRPVYQRPVDLTPVDLRRAAVPTAPVQTYTFGALGDSHICSRYARPDVLDALYQIYADAGVTRVFHTGNFIEGEARFNRNDITVTGLDAQVKYFVQTYPSYGIDTYFIAGDDHEGWYVQREGVDIGMYTEDIARRAGRPDLHYLGYMERDVLLDDNCACVVRVLHPGGGSAYSLGYTAQKIIDSYLDREKPDILLYGHYHKASFLPNYRGVWAVQTGTTQEQTPFMRKKRLNADLGGWLLKVGVDEAGHVVRMNAEFISFAPHAWAYRMDVY